MSTNPEGQGPLDPPSFSAEIDAIYNRFEAAWKAGQRPPIQDYLGQLPDPGRAELFRHLLALELHYRRAAGETPTLDQYRERFPDFLVAVTDAFPTVDRRIIMKPSYWERWNSGLDLLVRMPLMAVVAFGPAIILGKVCEWAQEKHYWIVLVCVAIPCGTYVLFLMPVVFDWIAHKFRFPLRPPE